MENLIKRFPVVGVKVLKNLGNQSLFQGMEASRGIAELVENERFFWIRIFIKKNKD